MARDKEKNLELRNVDMPKWMGQWSLDHKGSAMVLWLIFAPETTVSKYYNKKYPEKALDYSVVNNNFKHHDFNDYGWETYVEMENNEFEEEIKDLEEEQNEIYL